MAQNQYTEFKNEVLIPALLDRYLPEAFPSMEFVWSGDHWISKYHIDGKISSGRDQSYIYKSGTKLHDNNGAEIGIFDFAMAQFGTDFMDTLKRLADICNIPLPDVDPEYAKRMAAAQKRLDSLNASMERQKAALFTPEGKVVLDYLHNKRGYTDETIKAMGLGYLSASEAAKLTELGEELPTNIADFPLSMPYTTRGKLRGFKFRYVTEEAKAKYGKNKYRNTMSLGGKMNTLPFLYSPTNIQDKVIIVEGELDALHIYAKGIKNIVATSGGALQKETLSLLMEGSPLKRVIFIPDNDENGNGYRYVENGIKIVEEKNLEAFVVTIPEGSKDADEYLAKKFDEDLTTLINNAEKAVFWRYEKLIADTQKKHQGESLTDIQDSETREAVFNLVNSCKDETDRQRIIEHFAGAYGGGQNIEEAFRIEADKQRERKASKARADIAKNAADAYSKLVKDGKITEANSFMAEVLTQQKQLGGIGTYGDLLKVPTRAERLARFRDKPEALETSYQFDKGGKPLPLTLPSGALSIIAAPTSHGKSTFLRNLALDVATRYDDKSVLYFTFEESEEDVIAQFTNTYVDTLLHEESTKHPQLEAIVNYYRTGNTEYIKENVIEDFKRKEEEFSTDYLDSGRIRIFYRDYNLETLIDALEFAVNHIPAKAIFVDYIQILRSQRLARQPRNEQLKEICISLKDFSVKYKLPVVLAAQLTREAKTPLRMDNSQMAESSDIEKAANTIICLWNSAFKASTYGDKGQSKDETEELNRLEKEGFKLGTPGYIFAKLTKKRGSRGVGMYALLKFNGYSGKIVENIVQGEEKAAQNITSSYEIDDSLFK